MLEENVQEAQETQSDSGADHARILELRESLSLQFDKTGFERIDKIVNDATNGTEQVVEEVLAKIRTLGIVGSECQRVTKEISEYATLMKKITPAKPE